MMVNRLLKKDATARKKQLHIRTYAVVPLSENSGIVEWVSRDSSENSGIVEWDSSENSGIVEWVSRDSS